MWFTVYIQQCTDAKKFSCKNDNKNNSFQLLQNHHKQNYISMTVINITIDNISHSENTNITRETYNGISKQWNYCHLYNIGRESSQDMYYSVYITSDAFRHNRHSCLQTQTIMHTYRQTTFKWPIKVKLAASWFSFSTCYQPVYQLKWHYPTKSYPHIPSADFHQNVVMHDLNHYIWHVQIIEIHPS